MFIRCLLSVNNGRGQIVIHQYKNNGYNIVLDTNSGAVHVVDDLVYDVIGLLDQGKDSNSI